MRGLFYMNIEANERGGIKWNRISKQNRNLTKTLEMICKFEGILLDCWNAGRNYNIHMYTIYKSKSKYNESHLLDLLPDLLGHA
jgi:hypothetical protein